MDNLPKDEQPEEAQSSGDIFSSDQVQEAPFVPSGESLGEQFGASSEGDYSGGASVPPPPPFEENHRKKYLIFVLGIIIVVIVLSVVLLAVRSFTTQKPKLPENITLTYWGLWEDSSIMQPIIEEYKRSHPQVTVNYVKQDTKQYRERLQAAISRGEGPDIFRFHNTWTPMLLKELSPMPKSIYSDTEFSNTFYPVAVKDLKIGSNIYGLPLEIDGLMLFYNEDILKGSSIVPPKTWIDMQDAVAKLVVKQGGKIITGGAALGTAENVEHFSDIVGLMMLQNGTQLSKSLFSCNDQGSTSCAVEALRFYRKFAEVPNNVWDDTLDNSIIAFANGKVAMVIAPSWQAITIQQIVTSNNSKLNFKTTPVPQLPCPGQTCPRIDWATYWVEGVSSKSKYQESAWEFLKYLSQKETMQKLFDLEMKQRTLFGEPYSRVDLGGILAKNSYLAPLAQEAASMQSFYLASDTHDGDTGIDTSMIVYLKNAVNSLSSGASPESALKTADDGFKQIFARFGISSTQ